MSDLKQILPRLYKNLNTLQEREAKYGGSAPLDLLNRYNLLPFDLISFLNQATDLLFLQRLGGSYRFIHRSVQEHFAAKWVEETGESVMRDT